ncbi:MAG: LysR family transcriptional regulator [Acidobacteriia bacterium]|nr:LysR family transcriptional regulator [Terriglobia bacterium]
MTPAYSIERLGQRILDMRQLHTFRVVAITKNFTRAAAELGCCQSTVTVHIRALERELGISLFERNRSSKRVVLTDEGKRALEYAQRLLALANEVQDVISPGAGAG